MKPRPKIPDNELHVVFLALGSNLGDREKNIEQAYREIDRRIGKVISKSTLYASDPEGFESANRFANTVCKLLTTLDARQVLFQTQVIERKLGRTEKTNNGKCADRIIDIDILTIDNQIIEEPGLIVPHPRMHLRHFVLIPFAEISPNTLHPVLDKSIIQLKNELTSVP